MLPASKRSNPMITVTVYGHVLPGNQREAANTVREADR